MKKYLKYIILIVILILLFSIPYIIKNIEKNDKIEPFLIENAQIEDITFNQNKINIYLFWGDGCPHCEELKEYFKSLEKKYSKYCTIYTFEVWNNETNGQLMDTFAKKLGDEVGSRSVPYYIIGDESISGYTNLMNEDIASSIRYKYRNRAKIENFEELITQSQEINF